MLRRLFWLVIFLLLGAFPVSAQSAVNPIDSIPADFAGFVRLNVTNRNTLIYLNELNFFGGILQPGRFGTAAINNLDAFVPLAQLSGVTEATFTTNIAPWLSDEIILGVSTFEADFSVNTDNLLVVLPTADYFAAASYLSTLVQDQQLLDRETYLSTSMYIGDYSTFALAPDAIFIGREELVRAALDTLYGDSESLTVNPAYAAVSGVETDDSLLFAYLNGSYSLQALSFALNQTGVGEPLLEALGKAMETFRARQTAVSTLLSQSVDSLGLSLKVDDRTRRIETNLRVYNSAGNGEASSPSIDLALLEMIPRSVMLMQSGTDARNAVYDLLVSLPISNFAARILGSFPVQESVGSASGRVAPPTATDIETSVTTFLSALDAYGNFNLETHLIDYLGGNYAAALIPRPNDPAPYLNTPYDVLLLLEVTDAEAAQQGMTQLVKTILDIQNLESEVVRGETFDSVQVAVTGETVVRVGTVNNVLIVATGHAAERALAAQAGDNRLIDEQRWQSLLADDVTPQFYLDILPVYNTFLPTAGGAQIIAQPVTIGDRDIRIGQLGASSSYLGDGVFQVDLMVTAISG